MSTKTLIILAVLLFGVATSDGSTERHSNFQQPPAGKTHSVPIEGVELTLHLLRASDAKWEFELTVHNSSVKSVFVMAEPVRSNGSRGAYLSIDTTDQSVLVIGVLLYSLPDYSIYSNHAGVALKRLEPNGNYNQVLSVTFPSRETSPPYKDPLEFKMIAQPKVRFARAVLGVLPDEEGVQGFLDRKERIGPYADGVEMMESGAYKGKRLIEIQSLALSPKIKVPGGSAKSYSPVPTAAPRRKATAPTTR